MNWSRGAFLKASAGAAAAVALLGAGTDLLRRRGAPVVAAPELTPAELDTVAIVALVLFPADSESERALIDRTARWWAAGRSARGKRLPVYRAGLAALAAARRDAGHTRPFGALPPAARRDIVASLMSGSDEAPFRRFAAELLEGLYSDAPGWTLVGYRTWPGTPSSPGEHTRPPRARS